MTIARTRSRRDLIQSLRWHPVRLISFLDRPYYYGAKKKYLDWIAVAPARHRTLRSFPQLVGRLSAIAPRDAQARHSFDRGNPHLASGSRESAGRSSTCPASDGGSFRGIGVGKKTCSRLANVFWRNTNSPTCSLSSPKKRRTLSASKGFPRRNCFISPRGVDTERFKPGVAPADLSRGFFRGPDRAQGYSPSSGGVASARSQRRGAMAGGLCA